MKSSSVILVLRNNQYYRVVTGIISLDFCIFARFKVNCEIMPLRSFPNFKLVMSRCRKELRGPPKARGPRLWPIRPMLGLPYVRFFPDMSWILVAKYASGRNVKKCFNVRDFGIIPFMKSNRNVFTVRITKC